MDVGHLDVASNRATFQRETWVIDDDTDELLDLTGRTIVFEVKRPWDCWAVLSATTDNGKVVIVETGKFQVRFERSEMTNLSPGTYDVGITVANADGTSQLFEGTLPVVGGVVQK